LPGNLCFPKYGWVRCNLIGRSSRFDPRIMQASDYI
jgi:hypothetical protein